MAQAMTNAKLRTWMRKASGRLINLSTAICRDRHRAEEVVQEAFIKLWRQPPEAGEIAYASWLRRVVTNLSINALQRTRRPGPLPRFSDDPALRTTQRPERRGDVQESLQRVQAAMDRLDECLLDDFLSPMPVPANRRAEIDQSPRGFPHPGPEL